MKKRSVGEGGGIAAWNQPTRRGRRGVKGELSILDTWILSGFPLHALRPRASADLRELCLRP